MFKNVVNSSISCASDMSQQYDNCGAKLDPHGL